MARAAPPAPVMLHHFRRQLDLLKVTPLSRPPCASPRDPRRS